MNLGQFHAQVSSAIKRGTSLDAIIPMWVSQAQRLLEQNYTFSWMGRSSDSSLPAATTFLTLDPLVKNIEWIKPRWVGSGNTVWFGDPIVGVDERMVTGIGSGNPSGFYLTGDEGSYKANFDAAPGEAWLFRMRWHKYTEWPTNDAATPVLLLRGEMALFAQTLVLFANAQRDARMAEVYTGILQGALSTLLRSEEELKMAHQNDLKMGYSGLE